MTALRVLIDEVIADAPSGISRYTEGLTRALIAGAPEGSEVHGIVSAIDAAGLDIVEDRVPGLAALHRGLMIHREYRAAWQHAYTALPGEGLIHSPSLFAPLFRHDRAADPSSQIAVTIHDATAWTHPELLAPRELAWQLAMAKRAVTHADAIVTPSHAVAAELSERLGLGDRVRVVSGAPSARLLPPADIAERAARLALPEQFVLAVGSRGPRSGIDLLVRALASPALRSVRLLVTGPDRPGDLDLPALAAEAGVSPQRIRMLGAVDDSTLAVLLDCADALVAPSRSAGFGMAIVEAFVAGTPVVHTDVPAYTEVAAGAGFEVPLAGPGDVVTRLGDAVDAVLSDDELARRLSVLGQDRAKAFGWRDSAERVWELHADL